MTEIKFIDVTEAYGYPRKLLGLYLLILYQTSFWLLASGL